MSTITALEFQQQSAELLERVRAGEQLLIVSDGQPVAERRPVSVAELAPRPRGRCAGQFRVPDDIDAPPTVQILQEFEGR